VAIAYVAERGSAEVSSGTNDFSALTITLTNPTAIAVGNHLILRIQENPDRAILSVADSRGHNWQEDATSVTGSARNRVWSAKVATAFQAGDTIVITVTGGLCASIIGVVDEFSGLAATAWRDQTTTGIQATASTTFDSNTAATTVQAAELIFGALALSGALTTITPAAATPSWTALGTKQTSSASFIRSNAAHYRIVAATEDARYNGTLASSRINSAVLVTSKGFVEVLPLFDAAMFDAAIFQTELGSLGQTDADYAVGYEPQTVITTGTPDEAGVGTESIAGRDITLVEAATGSEEIAFERTVVEAGTLTAESGTAAAESFPVITTESGTGTETIGQFDRATGDTGMGTDTSNRDVTLLESGTGIETGIPSATLSAAEAGALATEAASVSVPVAASDSGTGSEAVVQLDKQTGDTASGSEAIARDTTATEAGAGAEAVSGRDVTLPDAGSASEAVSDRAVVLSDTGLLTTESAVRSTVGADSVVQDSGSGAEGVPVVTAVLGPTSESGVANESISIAYLVTEAGVGSDAMIAPQVALMVSDAGTGDAYYVSPEILPDDLITALGRAERGTLVPVGKLTTSLK
jgi:antitoxin (DNA-binding transcriptional repressor) of toxin-antitoxin stability system